MTLELNLRFPDSKHLIVSLVGEQTNILDFVAPITAKDREEIRWYIETYAALYTTDVDDAEARRIEGKLPRWGTALFDAIFHDRAAQRLYNQFHSTTSQDRLLTISAEHSAILPLPWELLHDPKGGYLFNENPRISIRRVAESTGERRAFAPKTKLRLRLLFVTSRPAGAGFIDPRADSQAVMDAVEQYAPGRIEVEFLRLSTFRNLAERLENKNLPTVDVIHFDGHGEFDIDGNFGDGTPNTGYLLFENKLGLKQYISPKFWHDTIGDGSVSLVVLSACQSAAMGDSEDNGAAEDPMGSVAYGLTALGVPAVLAMSHSVLATTTEQLFGEFYRHLAEGKGIGVALDNARHHLMQNPDKHEVQRGTKRIRLTLQDWFLPVLYQIGKDVSLLDASTKISLTDLADNGSEVFPPASTEGVFGLSSELPKQQEAGFFGRQRELWELERYFVEGTRRISITGFGGQGKTYLAAEAGRWLQRTGMFHQVTFVGFAVFQGIDAVGYAVATLSSALKKSLVDENAVAQTLRKVPTLLILDNLETLAPAPLAELLTITEAWSECGDSRILITSRTLHFAESKKHRGITLAGLGEQDALNFFQSLMMLPPAPQLPSSDRETLLKLFRMVDFHPLSLRLLAEQLKTRHVEELGERLESLLVEGCVDKNKSLRASLQLSLDRLDAQARQWLPRLGVFQGGAMEITLLDITEIPEVQWPAMRERLQAAALIDVESFEGVLYLKFHPSLAPMLWSQLPQSEQDSLNASHQQSYYHLSTAMRFGDDKLPHHFRTIAQRELPNLLYAVNGALATSNEWAADFTDNVGYFLYIFGLNRDYAALIERGGGRKHETGSREWYVYYYHLGAQLLSEGRIQEAKTVYRELLAGLGNSPSYGRCATLNQLGQCLRSQGQPNLAEKSYREGLAIVDKLEPSDDVKFQYGSLQTELGNVLTDMARYTEARAAYEASLAVAEELRDFRSEAIIKGQLGTLALSQGDLPEAGHRYSEAISIFQRLDEPTRERIYEHQLGLVFQQAGQSEAAEEAYRDSARIAETQGDFTGAAHSWNQLAMLNEDTGKLQAAEAWYRKALDGYRIGGAVADLSKTLSNLAYYLLQNRPGCLAEARQLAEESLAIKKALDPSVAQIWHIYSVLAKIADKENDPAQARDYRRRERTAYINFPGNRNKLQEHSKLIVAVLAGVRGNLAAQQAVSREQEAINQVGGQWVGLPQAIDHILAGERDAEALTANLDALPSLIVDAILVGIKEASKPLTVSNTFSTTTQT